MTANLSPVASIRAPSSGSNEYHRLDDSPRSSICRRITDFCQRSINFLRNLYRHRRIFRLTLGNPPVANPPMPNPHLMAPPGIDPFGPIGTDVTAHILSFLENKDLRVQDSMSRYFRPSINLACRERCQNERFLPVLPEGLPAEVNYRQFLLNLFPNAIKADFFEEYFGEVDTVPRVPRNFIEMAPRPGFKLVFIPEYITITVDANSPLMLDEATAVNGKKARLIENRDRPLLGQARQIKVPVTPNNFILLAQKYLKKNLPSRFGGMHEYSWTNVLDQNGDIGVGPSHWSYQKEEIIGLGKPYRSQPNGMKGQEEMARDQGLEIVPLGERILFHLSSYIKSGKIPQSANIERTSTVVPNDFGNPRQSSIWWEASGPVFRLSLIIHYDVYFVGAAVRVPAGSSQAIGR